MPRWRREITLAYHTRVLDRALVDCHWFPKTKMTWHFSSTEYPQFWIGKCPNPTLKPNPNPNPEFYYILIHQPTSCITQHIMMPCHFGGWKQVKAVLVVFSPGLNASFIHIICNWTTYCITLNIVFKKKARISPVPIGYSDNVTKSFDSLSNYPS